MSRGNCGALRSSSPGRMCEFDKLPKALRVALANADHNWNGEQLYREFKRRNAKVRTVAIALAFLRDQDAKQHIHDTTSPGFFGVMPGQRQRVAGVCS